MVNGTSTRLRRGYLAWRKSPRDYASHLRSRAKNRVGRPSRGRSGPMSDAPHRGGQGPREFTAEERNQAEVLSGIGLPHRQIAVLLACDEKTLRRHLGEELTRGDAKATAKVAQSLFQMATVEKSVAAAIFWMKARAGWRERHDVQLTTRPLREPSDAELERIIQLNGPDGTEDAPTLEASPSPEPAESG